MQIEIKELTDEKVYFRLKNVNKALANGFRRIILAEVPTYAIGDVLIEKNTSIHINDYIIQRLNLLPIDSNNRSMIPKMPIECVCTTKQCNQCAIMVSVNIISSKHKNRIFIKDLFPNDFHFHFTKDAFDIPLFVLNSGEQFKAILILRKGIGHQHAMFKPACVVIAKPTPSIVIESNYSNDILKQLVPVCPKKIFQFHDNIFSIQNVDQCIYCDQCTTFAIENLKIPKLININEIEDDFLITIESVGTLNPATIFTEAVQIMKQKLNELNL